MKKKCYREFCLRNSICGRVYGVLSNIGFGLFINNLNFVAPSGSCSDLKIRYSTLESVIPVVVYSNCKIDKKKILEENKGKAGIYR
jgi:hypothetical protein